MTNDFDSREWAENHTVLSDGIEGLFRSVMYSFERLVAIEYDAPWQRVRPECKER